MFQVPNSSLYIGNKEDAKNLGHASDYCIVHACKSFFDTVENTENFKNNPKLKVFQNELYVDWVDLPDPNLFDILTFNEILDWIKQNSDSKKKFIHCDWGQSRSATLTMVYMAKILHILPDDFHVAITEFKQIYPDYIAPSGISFFVKKNWAKLGVNLSN